MKTNHRIRKIAVLAAIIIVVLFSGFPVHAQTTSRQIIPQIAVGSADGVAKNVTIIQVINAGPGTSTVSGQFYSQTGDASSIPFTTVYNNVIGSFNGTFSATIRENTTFVIIADSAGAPVTSWARITSTGGSIIINTVFELRSLGNNALLYRVGVAASADNIRKFVIPRMRNPSAFFDVGFALVNTGAATVTITGKLYDADGTLLRQESRNLLGQRQAVGFASEFFDLTETGSQTRHSFMIFEASGPQVAALGLAFEGLNVTSFPINVLP
jgi:hypothetical protein